MTFYSPEVSKTLKIFVVSILGTFQLFSYQDIDIDQRAEIDSLNAAVLQDFYSDSAVNDSIAKLVLKKAEKSNYLYGVAVAASHYSLYLNKEKDYKQSLSELFKSINILKALAQESQNTPEDLEKLYEALHFSYLLIFNVFRLTGHYEMQSKYANLAEESLLKTDYTETQMIRIKASKASIYSKLGLHDEALQIYYEVLSFFEHKKNVIVTSDLRGLIALVNLEKDNPDKALKEIEIAIKDSDSINHSEIRTASLLIKSRILNYLEEYNEALQIIALIEEDMTQDEISKSSDLNMAKGKSYFGKKLYVRAEDFLRKALNGFIETNKKEKIIETAEILKDLYLETKNLEKSLEMNAVIENFEKEFLETKLQMSVEEIKKLELVSTIKSEIKEGKMYDKKISYLLAIILGSMALLIIIWIFKKNSKKKLGKSLKLLL